MPIWIIEPHDPLIVRDGRPFGPTPGARAKSLSFPFPSTTTGGLRNRAGTDKSGVFDRQQIDEVKQIAVRGPLLVEVGEAEETSEAQLTWLAPAPADALLLELEHPPSNPKQQAIRKRLVPLESPEALSTNLPAEPPQLHLVGQVHHSEGKPHKEAPRFWYWKQFEQWLSTPTVFEDPVVLKHLGHSGPAINTRMHVSMNRDTQIADEGKLFQTSGLEFTLVLAPEDRDHDVGPFSTARRLALAVTAHHPQPAETEAPQMDFAPCIASLGGERRMVTWRKLDDQDFPSCPEGLVQQVQQHTACRVILLTPAYLKRGWLPTWLLQEREGVRPVLKAAAFGRPQVVSGWDLEKGSAKPTRRLAPSGTVFFLKLDGTSEAIKRWIEAVWMQCISDKDEDQRDGFGLAVVGVWDGQCQHQQMKGKSDE